MPRRTKIVATLGPATDKPGVLEAIIRAGVNVCRLNFSHGVHADHIRRATEVREIAAKLGREVGILSDLQGPKIRTDRFIDGKVELEYNQQFILDADLAADQGTKDHVGIAYKTLPQDVKAKDILLLDDGKIILEVLEVKGNKVITRVEVAGILSNNKGINLQGGGLSAPALTDKDKEDLICAANFNTDYIAVSFPRNGDDIRYARELLTAAGSKAGIIAKIERTEALECIDDIILASDSIMIARGDLAVEIGDAQLVGVQKRFIKRARQLDRTVITATQMMESMIDNQSPTRAEVMDVANAVLDGTDAVMLSAETASGKYPEKTVLAMARICEGAESERDVVTSRHRMDEKFERTDEAIAMAAMYIANHYKVAAIACMTESGATPLWMSRISSGIPIYAMTRHEFTRRKVTLFRGVYPVAFEVLHGLEADVLADLTRILKTNNAIKSGDRILVTRGELDYTSGGTNSIKIVDVK